MLCECGCGGETKASSKSRRGYLKGEPLRFMHGHNRRTMSEAERFHKKLRRDRKTGCLLFTGHKLKGYGQFGIGSKHNGTRRLVYAHQFAWELAHGPVPPGKNVLHECDNPPCCEPDHLWLGTIAQNQFDMAKKDRARRGEMPRHVARNHSRFMVNVRGKYYGTFDTIQEAATIAQKVRREVYGR